MPDRLMFTPAQVAEPARVARASYQGPRRGLRRPEAAAYIGVSESKFDELVRAGRMPEPLKLGTCAIWDLRRLDLAFDALSGDDAEGDLWADVK
jgi:predicted DNA-binding transcriptional regulator AlpA